MRYDNYQYTNEDPQLTLNFNLSRGDLEEKKGMLKLIKKAEKELKEDINQLENN